MKRTLLEIERLKYKPSLPPIFRDLGAISLVNEELNYDNEEIEKLFPNTYGKPLVSFKKGSKSKCRALKIGVVFSGGQAAGGHNVIGGLYDALISLNGKSLLFGFLNGPSGLIENKFKKIDFDLLKDFRNMGGFDLIGSGRTKIETEAQLSSVKKTAQDLDGIVIIGGDDSNTNAAILAEYFLKENCKAQVIGVPKTIDGDLRHKYLEITFGFDTASKTYSEIIGNIERDAISAKKYYHFIKLMGRSASHITLECALTTCPNLALIGEEVKKENKKLSEIVSDIADLISKREELGKNYGVILIPEGLVEFIPEMKNLISELNNLLADGKGFKESDLGKEAYHCYSSLPIDIAKGLLSDRDPHGNVQVSKIETEKLLINLVSKELKRRNFKKGLNAVSHFIGYEGRAGFPSNFDAEYCYGLGYVAAILLKEGLTGYMCSICNLKEEVQSWECKGIPLSLLLNMERRKGELRPVIKKALVDFKSKSFKTFSIEREKNALEDLYKNPGPIQFFGDKKITDSRPLTL